MNEFEINGAEINGVSDITGGSVSVSVTSTFTAVSALRPDNFEGLVTTLLSGLSDTYPTANLNQALSSTSASASSILMTYGYLLSGGDTADAASTLELDLATVVVETALVQSSLTDSGVYTWGVTDTAAAASLIQAALDQLVADSATGTDDWFVESGVLLVEQLAASSTLITTVSATMTVAELIVALDLGDRALLESVLETVEGSSSVTQLLAATYTALSQALAESATDYTVAIYPVLTDTAAFADGLTVGQVLNLVAADEARVFIRLSVDGETYTGWVMNTQSGGVTEYQGLSFNSMAKIAGKYYGATEGGIYEMAGGQDGTTDIHTYIQSGLLDFGTAQQKAVTNAYLAVDVDGRIAVGVGVSEKTGIAQYWYEVSMDKDAPDNVKLPIGRGLKGRYWKFEIASEALTSFESVTVLPVVLTRKV